jgi:hypothetical protein
MKSILKNWRTSLIGGGALTAGLTVIINDPTQWKEGVSMCIVGLIGVFAKDGKVTGL